MIKQISSFHILAAFSRNNVNYYEIKEIYTTWGPSKVYHPLSQATIDYESASSELIHSTSTSSSFANKFSSMILQISLSCNNSRQAITF